MTATEMLQRQHRHLEQKLALLEAHAEQSDCEAEFADLVVELTAHLAAEAHVFYSAAEGALGQELTEQRRCQESVRQAMSAAASSRNTDSFPRRLFDLTETFKRHSRVEERAVHPSLDGVLGPRQLTVLGAKVAALHSAVGAVLRSGKESSGLVR